MSGGSESLINWEAIWESLNWDAGAQQQTVDQTLAQRARKYAQPLPGDDLADVDTLPVLVFFCGEERYALPVAYVMQGLDAPHITPVPGTPPFYRGVINLRGRIVSVLDVAQFWGIPQEAPPADPKLLIVNASGLEIALLAGEIGGLQYLPAADIAPPGSAGVALPHVQGVSPEGVALIDVAALLADPRLVVHDEF